MCKYGFRWFSVAIRTFGVSKRNRIFLVYFLIQKTIKMVISVFYYRINLRSIVIKKKKKEQKKET